ncbi:hypothetical protein [Lactococcus ileimucosae]|uniref:hypothetical protein n=1 Tax=Lactococcus ileimucosae TaxID=2941329 RepID=UPI0020441D77|nr:hypothetical protein [Lactococcus ileimucosae]
MLNFRAEDYIIDEVVSETKINLYPENTVLLVGIASIDGCIVFGSSISKIYCPNLKLKSTDVEKESQVIDLQEKINQGSLTISQAERISTHL